MQLQRRQHVSSTTHPAAGYAIAVAGALCAVLIALAADRWLGLADLSLVFMLAVLVVATRTRSGPAVLTALLCFLAYNYFFIEPRYTFYISARHGVTTVVLFLAAALLAGRLASQLAMQVQALRTLNREVMARQVLGQRLTVAADANDVLRAAMEVFQDTLGAQVWIQLEQPPYTAGDGAMSVTQLMQSANRSNTVEEHGWWFLPLRAPQGTMGMMGLKLPTEADTLDDRQRDLARAMTDDIAQALLRTRLVAELESERVGNETERLRNALLSSVSHDLRTPLAAIIGAAGSLDSYGAAMDGDDRHALLEMIRTEGERLDRYIQNLLDMTRLGHGAMVLHREWIGVDELIGSAVGRLRRYQPDARFRVSIAPEIGPIWVHPALVEQALFNVIENAVEFSPPDQPVDIRATSDGASQIRIDVRDYGPGIPEAERQRIFDMFVSVERGDRSHQGTGLGLAICRGMIGAHGGDVVALPAADGAGAVLSITLPLMTPT